MTAIVLLLGWISPTRAAQSPAFASGVALGEINSDWITEASGLAASRQNPGVLWTHNDNGLARLFAISTNALLLAIWEAPEHGGDLEDIAIGPGPQPDLDYIYLGDIGDNTSSRLSIELVRIPEPAAYLYTSDGPATRFLSNAVSITLMYPDGSFDAEALMSDPVTGDIFIATKDINAANSRLYRAPKAALDAGGPVVLEYQRTLSFRAVSAGDISADGSEIVLRRGSHAQLWKRAAGQTVTQAFGTSSTEIPLIGNPDEPNGEAIGFHPTGLGYYTISEGMSQPVYFFRRTSSDAPVQPLILMPPTSQWKFYDLEVPTSEDWFQPAFDDASWKLGPGKLGYGQPDVLTTVDFGPDPDFKIITTYFRGQFWMGNPAAYTNIALRFLFNDGVAIYLNGAEIYRRNLDPGASFFDVASADRADLEQAWTSLSVGSSQFHQGTNVFAIELHRYISYGPSLSFDFQITARPGTTTVQLAGPPELVGDSWRIPVLGPLGARVGISGSGDLNTWDTLGFVDLPEGYGVYSDPISEQLRFYRAFLP